MDVERVLGRLGDAARPGPTVLFIAGMHGNEPAGLLALERVFKDFDGERGSVVNGNVLALAGNLPALSRAVRFVDRDLNRLWVRARLPGEDARPEDAPSVEHAERIELLRELRKAVRDAQGPVFCIDLHTTSGDGPPFVVFSDTLRNRRFVAKWPCPLILGIEERIGGSLSECMSLSGAVAAAFEGGRHDDPASVDWHEAAIRIAMVSAGSVRAQDMPGYDEARRMLRDASRGIPRILDVIYRHGLRQDHDFEMSPGFPNFTPVMRGRRLATDADPDDPELRVAVTAQRTGRILLPLYQGQGDDGYFIARVISRLWLFISGLMRRCWIDRLVTYLPGVRRVPGPGGKRGGWLERRYEIDRRVARWLAEDVFHLAGFRVVHETDEMVRVARRPHDLRAPEKVDL